MDHTTLQLARLLHQERLTEAEACRRARAAADHRRAERLETRAARLRERAAGRGAVWVRPRQALPRTL